MKKIISAGLCMWLAAIGFAHGQFTTIDGVYLERDTSSFPITKKVTIQDHDIIVFDVPGLGDYMTEGKISVSDVVLLFNQIPLAELTPVIENRESGVVRFEFSERAITSSNRQLLYNLPGGAVKEIQLGIKLGDEPLHISPRAKVMFGNVKNWSKIGGVLILAFVLFFVVLIVKFKSLIKDTLPQVENAEKVVTSFSLGKSQLAFWTFIVISSFIYIWVYTGDLNAINNTALILLGISAGTLAGSALAADEQENIAMKNNSLNQLINSRTSDGSFFKDILSDNHGINIHRFQTFVFNILFGVAFFKSVILNYSMPEFNETQLLLLGLSNGTYAFLKRNENK